MFIETKNLILRNYTMNDLEDYWEYVSQPNVGPRCGWEPYTSKEAAKERLEYECGRPLQFAIELKSTGKVIGSIEVMEPKRDCTTTDNAKELGCLLNENYWGKGVMTEALTSIVKYCFDDLRVEEVVAGYFEPNVGSGRVQEKAGLVPFGRIENYITWYLTGELCDCILNRIGREEYLKNPLYRNLEINVREGRGR